LDRKNIGIKAIHVWKLESNNNKTIVNTEESWMGIIVNIIQGWMQKTLDESTESGLKHLKVGIENTLKP
jgi:hypothetical protein